MHYYFGDYELDTSRVELRRQGESIPIRSKVFHALLYLLQERHRVVSKQDLMASVWPQQSVSDETIGTCITEARQAIGDSGQQQHTIQTRRGHGYRFIASVTIANPPISPDAPIRQDLLPDANMPLSISKPFFSERRQLTVLCCDLLDALTLSQQLDPEALRDLVRDYRAACAKVIDRYGGYLAHAYGTQLLVYFGYPQAYEDAAQRAVRAGLELVQRVGGAHALPTLSQEQALSQENKRGLQLGIATGIVVIDTVDEHDALGPLALGKTPNQAVLLHSLAIANTVLISEETLTLVQDVFECHRMDALQLTRQDMDLAVYSVDRPRDVKSRFEVMILRGLTPFVARTQELDIIQDRWRQAQTGRGQVVMLSGEAGIGKSRLIQVFKDQLSSQLLHLLECQGSPYYQFTAFYPIIELLPRLLNLLPDDTPDVKLAKLEAVLEQYGLSQPSRVPFLAPLLGLSLPPAEEPEPPLTLQQQRQQTLAAVLALVLNLSAQQPILFIVEDIHWIDPSTLELLTLLIDQGPTAPMLTILACRPEFQSPWGIRDHVTPLTLQRLSPAQSQEMISAVAGADSLSDTVQQHIVDRTDGVPLFIEEMAKSFLEAVDVDRREADARDDLVAEWPIPSTLHDALLARLGRLESAKPVAQLGAVIGRQFPYSLLQAIGIFDAAMLQTELSRLVEAELLYQRGILPDATYMFKHALIQDTAYASLLKRTRQAYHEQIATVLATQVADGVDQQPELIAHHYTVAGLDDPAILYWAKAGQKAVQQFANAEAVQHLTQGLDLLQGLPASPERLQQELDMRLILGPALMATQGFGAEEVGHSYARARELCRLLGETPQLFPVYLGLWRFYLSQGEVIEARELSEHCLSLAQGLPTSTVLPWGHWALGQTLIFQGDFDTAREHLDKAIALYDPARQRPLYGTNPRIVCLAYMSLCLWFLGLPEQSLQKGQESIALAESLSEPFSLSQALNFVTIATQLRGDLLGAQRLAERGMQLSIDQQFPQRLAVGRVHLGWAIAMQGQAEKGSELISQGRAGWATTGAKIAESYYLKLLAEAYQAGGRIEVALSTLDEALGPLANPGEHWWDADLYRIKGELLQQLPVAAEVAAEACFQQGLDIARQQQAKSWELRVAMSLCRLWRKQGKRDDARTLLFPLYDSFSEGFDTADLQEAQQLIAELQ